MMSTKFIVRKGIQTMKTALITGTSSGIGLAIAQKLLENKWKVIGISRNDSPISDTNFINYKIDLTKISDTERLIKELIKDYSFDLLVNNAGVGFYGLHEELNSSKIHKMTVTNIEIPLLLTNLMMRQLKQNHGIIANISSVTAGKSNPHGAAYGATKAALTSFGASIFDEARKYGIRVITIEPDMTDTNLYRNADFIASNKEGCSLSSSDVASAIWYAISSGCVTHIKIQPQYHRIQRKEPAHD